ncbi:MAG: hypothetical protein ACRCZJ_01770, partial [Erysipelotrichaceae bacterium]
MIRRNNGSILPFVLVVFFVATVFGVVLATMGLTQNTMSNHEVQTEQAFLSATSITEILEKNVNSVFDLLEGDSFVPVITDQTLGLGLVSAKITKETEKQYLLSVKANYNDVERTVYTSFEKRTLHVGQVTVSQTVEFCGTANGLKFPESLNTQELFNCKTPTIYDSNDAIVDHTDEILVAGGNIQPTFVDNFNNSLFIQPTVAKECVITKNDIKINKQDCRVTEFGNKANERKLYVEATEGTTVNIILVVQDSGINKLPTSSSIDGIVSNQKPEIYVQGKGKVNIWIEVPAFATSAYYTLPQIIKNVEEDQKKALEVNVIATAKNLNLVIYNNDDQTGHNSKGNGTIDANIFNHQGTVILASDSEKNNAEMGEFNISGTIEANRLVIDASERTNPFEISTDPDVGTTMIKFVSLGHIDIQP